MGTNDNDQDEYEESWMLNLQEFIDTLEPTIRDSTSSQELLELLANLESTDENFHRHNFVQEIKNKLDKELTPIIDNALEHLSVDDLAVSDVSRSIIESKEFMLVSATIGGHVKFAAQNISEHLNSVSFDFSDMPKIDTKGGFYRNDSICSTSEGVDFMFMSPDRYKGLASEISSLKPTPTRLNALSILQQVPQTDLVASDAWESTRQGLLDALDDVEEEVNMRALKFISRLFLCGSNHVVREYFLILIKNLIDYFHDDTSHMISIESGLDLGDRRNVLLLRKFRLLNQIQLELPLFWLRYSENYIEEIMSNLLDLLSIIPTPISENIGKHLMSPLHFIALLDPLATWFKRWTHGFYGRSRLIKIITCHVDFLQKQVESCKNFQKFINNVSSNKVVNNEEDYVIYQFEDITYTHFLHSLNVVSSLMLYQSGRELFSLPVSTIESMLLLFIEILKEFPLQSLDIAKTLYHPVFLIVDVFNSLSSDRYQTLKLCLCDEVCKSLVTQIIQCKKSESSSNELLINVVSEILTRIVSSNPGIIMYGDTTSRDIFDITTDSIIHPVAVALNEVSNDRNDNSYNNFVSLMTFLREIYSLPDGMILLTKYDLVKKLQVCMADLQIVTGELLEKLNGHSSDTDKETCYDLTHDYESSLEREKELLKFLLSFSLTPKGVTIIMETNELHECVKLLHYMLETDLLPHNKLKKYDYSVMLYQLAMTQAGIISLEKSGYILNLLNKTWFTLEGYRNDYKKTQLAVIDDIMADSSFRKLFLFVIKLLSSFVAVRELFSRTLMLSSITEEKEININSFHLSSFYDFMEYLVILDSDSKRSFLYHQEETHFFGLSVLSTIVTCLDSMLFLQSNFNFQEVLLKMQGDCQNGPNTFILDQCSIQRNEILVKIFLIGGATERMIPPSCLLKENVFPYPWPLFVTFPVPDVYITRIPKPSTDKINPNPDLLTLIQYIENDKDSINAKNRTVMLNDLQKIFYEEVLGTALKNNDGLYGKLLNIAMALTQTTDRTEASKEKSKTSRKYMFTDSEECAIEMIVRYGLQLRVLNSKHDAIELLKSLIENVKVTLKSDSLNEHGGFDWFLAIIFLIFNQNVEDASLFLYKYSSALDSVYLWVAQLNYTSPSFIRKSTKVHPMFTNSCHYVELILRNELPQVYAAFRLSSYPPSQICQHWLRQCFLNYLDFVDVQWYVLLCVVMGIDYQVYFCVSILKHLQEDILAQTQNNDLVMFLKHYPISDFHVSEHKDFMKTLERKYRKQLLKDMHDI